MGLLGYQEERQLAPMRRDSKKWYFAYGSNMDVAQMQERKVRFWASKKAFLKGYRLTFDTWSDSYGAGVADVVPSPGSVVEGVVYLVEEEVLKILDQYEGVHRDFYRRMKVTVEAEDGETLTATCYEAVHKSQDIIPPSPKYLAKLIRGAETHDLSPSYIEMLRAFPVAD